MSLLNSAYPESRPLLFLVPHPSDDVEGTQLGWLTPAMALCLANNAWGRRRKEGGDIQTDGISLLKPQLCPAVLEMAACPWEEVNDFLAFLCLHVQFLIHLLNCLYLNLHVFLSFFQFSSPSLWETVSKRMDGAELPTGIKPHLQKLHRLSKIGIHNKELGNLISALLKDFFLLQDF